MKIAPIADVKARFSSYLRDSEERPVIITRNGKPVAVLLSLEDEEEIDRLVLAYSPKFQSILQASKRQIRNQGGIEHEDFWRGMEAKNQK